MSERFTAQQMREMAEKLESPARYVSLFEHARVPMMLRQSADQQDAKPEAEGLRAYAGSLEDKAYEWEAVHVRLDELGAPRGEDHDGGTVKFSLRGRIDALLSAAPVPSSERQRIYQHAEAMRAKLHEATELLRRPVGMLVSPEDSDAGFEILSEISDGFADLNGMLREVEGEAAPLSPAQGEAMKAATREIRNIVGNFDAVLDADQLERFGIYVADGQEPHMAVMRALAVLDTLDEATGRKATYVHGLPAASNITPVQTGE